MCSAPISHLKSGTHKYQHCTETAIRPTWCPTILVDIQSCPCFQLTRLKARNRSGAAEIHAGMWYFYLVGCVMSQSTNHGCSDLCKLRLAWNGAIRRDGNILCFVAYFLPANVVFFAEGVAPRNTTDTPKASVCYACQF